MVEEDELEDVVEAWLTRERTSRVDSLSKNVVRPGSSTNNNIGGAVLNVNTNSLRGIAYGTENSYAQSDTSSYTESPSTSRRSSPGSRTGNNSFHTNTILSPSQSTLQNERSQSGGSWTPSSRNKSRRLEAKMEDILENQRKLRSLELKLTRCMSSLETQEQTCSRLSRDFFTEKQKNANVVLEYNSLSHQLNMFRKRADNLDVLAQQCIDRREVDQITKAFVQPLRLEIQMQLENIGRQFLHHTKRMDELVKSVSTLKNSNGAVSERLNVLMKQQASAPKRTSIKASTNADTSLSNGVNNEILPERLWRKIDQHLEAQTMKTQRRLESFVENRFRALEGPGNSGASLVNSTFNNVLEPLGSSSQSLHDVQMRVQECYENVLRLGGQFAEEKERRSLMFQNIKNELKKYIREEISENSKTEMVKNKTIEESVNLNYDSKQENLTRIARAAAAAEVKSLVKRLSTAEDEIDSLKDLVVSLRSKLSETNHVIKNKQSTASSHVDDINQKANSLKGAATTKKITNTQTTPNGSISALMQIKTDVSESDLSTPKDSETMFISQENIPPPPSDDDDDEFDGNSSDSHEDDLQTHTDLSTKSAIHWEWKNVKAWLKLVAKASPAVISMFEKLEVIGVLLLEVEKDDLLSDEDMKIEDDEERERVWKAIYELRKTEGALSSHAEEF